ncbi:MAG: hypothetical protein P8Y45_06360 [Exilibacterium sp.]
MKLLRYSLPGSEKPGILDAAGHIRDLSGIVKDIDGKFLSEGGIERVANIDLTALPVVADDFRYGPWVGSVVYDRPLVHLSFCKAPNSAW